MDRLGKYEIRRVLGRGAMGTVYEGWDPIISRRVAIKTVRLPDTADSEEREQLGRFQQEAQAAGRLHHPNIVGVFDYAETDELAYIVMEFVDGQTLKSRLDDGEAPGTAEAWTLMDGLLTGLDYSHANQVIHRDIKPANIILPTAGGVKIADFGIARIESSTMTQAGTIMGTPAYMSPEQFAGTGIDARTDIYSAGVLLFQILTGRRPFEGNMATIMNAVMTQPAPRPSDLSASVPDALDGVVARAMARNPDDRYPTAAAFRVALKTAIDSSAAPSLSSGLGDLLGDEDATVVRSSSSPPSRPVPPGPAPRPAAATVAKRSAVPMVVAGVVILAALAGGGAFFALRGGGDTAPPAQTITAALPPPPTPVPTTMAPATPAPIAPAPDPVPSPAPAIQASAPPPAPTPPTPAPAVSTPAAPAPPAPERSVSAAPTERPLPTPPPPAPPPTAPPPAAPPPAVAEAPRPAPETPAPTVAPPPVVSALAPPSPEAVRRAVADAVKGAACTVVTGDVTAAGITLRGVAGRGGPEAALHTAIQDAAPTAAVDWKVDSADGPYCALFDAIRPFARPIGTAGRSLGIGLTNGRTTLTAEELVIPRATMPDFAAHLQLDYIANDGSILHMRDSVTGAAYPANATPVFGEPRPPGFKGWAVDIPFGTDIILGIASSAPLFRGPRPPTDTAEGYAAALHTALDQASRAGTRIATSVLMVTTTAKP